MGIETESEEIRKDMVKKLERQKIETALNNMRDAGHPVVRVLHLRLSGRVAGDDRSDDRVRDRAEPGLRQLLPGRALPRHCALQQGRQGRHAGRGRLVADGVPVLPARGNGLDEHVVMDAINRAKRRFFMRPSYLASRLGDMVKLAVDQAGDLRADRDADDLRRQGRRIRRGPAFGGLSAHDAVHAASPPPAAGGRRADPAAAAGSRSLPSGSSCSRPPCAP